MHKLGSQCGNYRISSSLATLEKKSVKSNCMKINQNVDFTKVFPVRVNSCFSHIVKLFHTILIHSLAYLARPIPSPALFPSDAKASKTAKGIASSKLQNR